MGIIYESNKKAVICDCESPALTRYKKEKMRPPHHRQKVIAESKVIQPY